MIADTWGHGVMRWHGARAGLLHRAERLGVRDKVEAVLKCAI